MAVGYALTGSTASSASSSCTASARTARRRSSKPSRRSPATTARQADFRTFIESKNDRGPRDDVAELFGARLVTAVEVGEGKRFNESLVKSLTGSDTVRARFLYESAFQFKPQFKLFLAANHKPVIRGTDEGIWRRVRLIPFTVQIPKAEQDKELLAKLREELPGILAWASTAVSCGSSAAASVCQTKCAPPATTTAPSPTRSAHSSTSTASSDASSPTPSKDLYDAYAQWAKEGGEFQLSQTAFGRRLEERGITSEKRGTWRSAKCGASAFAWWFVHRAIAQAPRNLSPRRGDQDELLFSGHSRGQE
jgi:putative DNA primase/helicase